jgi:hypothetical protein
MATTFAARVREDLDLISDMLSEEALALVAHARDTTTTGVAERDRLLAEIVAAYRRGPHEHWAPVILDLLAPGIIEILQTIDRKSEEISDMWDHDEPLVIDEEQLRAQLVMEVLAAVATIPIHPGGRAMKVRLLKRAYKYTVRWLIRDFRHQVWHCSLDAILEMEQERTSLGSRNPSRRARETTSSDDGN